MPGVRSIVPKAAHGSVRPDHAPQSFTRASWSTACILEGPVGDALISDPPCQTARIGH